MHHRLLSVHIVSSLIFLTPLLPRIFQKIFKIAQFSFETISAPQHAHIPSYTPQPRVPHHPPFPIPVFAVKKKISYPHSKERYNYHLSSQSFEEFTVYKTGCGCILRDVHLGKGDKGLSLFFPPIQNDSMSVLLIWRVQCRKKKETHTHNNWPTFSFFFKETINRSERKHTNMQLHVQSILLIFFFYFK